MKKISMLIAVALGLGSCSSYQSFSGAVAGGSLGGFFGSAVGGIIGGSRGADAGAVVGVLAGAAIGAKAAKGQEQNRSSYEYNDYNSDLEYGRIERRSISANAWQSVEVSNVRFFDTNDNRALDAGEQAYIEMSIYNNSGVPLYDVVPTIKCDNKRVRISSPAMIAEIESGRGVLYRVSVAGTERLKESDAVFSVYVNNNRTPVKQFRVRTKPM